MSKRLKLGDAQIAPNLTKLYSSFIILHGNYFILLLVRRSRCDVTSFKPISEVGLLYQKETKQGSFNIWKQSFF